MNPDKPQGDQAGEAAKLASLAKDWIALWQSELTAMAADRELREGWTQLMALWAGAASQAAEAAMRLAPSAVHDGQHDGTSRFSAGHEPPRTAPGAAASDAGGNEVERLHQRIAALEARLLAIERGAGGG
jgi:ubiquinone biosynthesis protein UbiJ